MSKIIDTLFYTDSHEWVKIEGEYAFVGITDFSQNQLGNIKYIDSGDVSNNVDKGDEFGSIESTKAASDLMAPLSGSIVEVNKELINSPELINKDPYECWIIKIKLTDLSEVDSLMDANAYRDFIKG